MKQPKLFPPGVIVNWLKGDPAETRANTCLEWDGSWELDAVYLGIPFDGAGTVRSGSRHAPDEVRRALPFYTAYSTTDGLDVADLRVADIGDVQTIVTDMDTTTSISVTRQRFWPRGESSQRSLAATTRSPIPSFGVSVRVCLARRSHWCISMPTVARCRVACLIDCCLNATAIRCMGGT